MELQAGETFAGYRIERLLGRGGMGAVYAVQHPRLPRRDALKVLAAGIDADADFYERFLREADLVARLNHPNIVIVHDRGAHHGTPWIAMQLIDGTDAAAMIRANPGGLPPGLALHIVTEAARGLDAAHRAGLLHRDIKPANIMLAARPGEPDRVLVTDFGIARAMGETTRTKTGAVLGTLAYAAPEQLSADTMDHRTDIYALGCMYFELLTGTKPFPFRTAGEVLRGHLLDPPPRPTALRPGLPPAIDAVIATALAKDPGHRHPSCGTLAAAAAAAFGFEVVPPDPPPPPQQQWAPPVSTAAVPLVQRRKRPLITAAVLAAVAVLAIVGILVFNNFGSAPPSVAHTATPTASATPTEARSPWDSYAFMVEPFPDLLPRGPELGGYQSIRCKAINEEYAPIDVNEPVQDMGRMACRGGGNPVDTMAVLCSAGRVPFPTTDIPPNMTLTGEQDWERPTGTGRLFWGDGADALNRPMGYLMIYFDDPDRNFCFITVVGGASGQELHDTWWPGAPL